ncbi:hypothetical protein GLOIN_2v1562605 [Rhizophagus irregularis DAOM 181602=DAOM 197198]|uniref:Uncharacterized protein n=1 Tax=Rhizophagus irregularis (strain DAOM 181602 / DAOM 197198 / MUCL 43194) TaxID=747089 RepID=A0A2P4QDT9_RHIID|nr:hypothetical protein GLOIN_2v1562605 [Rhizophagus irregularis DAOM 181602=DAOM 197198]POG75809.1 hypothetical protein GLOIN_2v1562605 [Rhizophagus irregularis DAOM 181602=DAOM 197198]GET56067.1 hypothetical protein GLOIN_2v1562605 [Rhizophagus irregularis DAOM 181602=DAOM 197198]|eukprot:XP_025182675.1 hypothetical protein GLOIN_2v1562605 [Rhizophagus irregularis DAOM 181602=DAOM 197198]
MNYLSIILLPFSFLPFSEALTHYSKGKISCENYFCYLVIIAILVISSILLYACCYVCLRQFIIKHKVIINQ